MKKCKYEINWNFENLLLHVDSVILEPKGSGVAHVYRKDDLYLILSIGETHTLDVFEHSTFVFSLCIPKLKETKPKKIIKHLLKMVK